MHRGNRDIVFIQIGQITQQSLFEVLSAVCLIGLVACGIAVLTRMATADINIDAIVMARRKLFLVGKWTVPFQNAWSSYTNDRLA